MGHAADSSAAGDGRSRELLAGRARRGGRREERSREPLGRHHRPATGQRDRGPDERARQTDHPRRRAHRDADGATAASTRGTSVPRAGSRPRARSPVATSPRTSGETRSVTVPTGRPVRTMRPRSEPPGAEGRMAAWSTMKGVGATALLTAATRALETERTDGLLSDPLARSLAGDEGFALLGLGAVGPTAANGSPLYVVRHRFLDDFLTDLTASSDVRQVVLLAAGLDTRVPSRLAGRHAGVRSRPARGLRPQGCRPRRTPSDTALRAARRACRSSRGLADRASR